VPCLDNWKAFIFASILCGRPPALACELRRPDKFKGALGLRALFNIPIGVEEALMGFVVGGSDTDRREGIRGTFVLSVGGLPAGEASGDSAGSVVRGTVAKSTESSGALDGPLFGGVAMADSDIYCRDMSLEDCDCRGRENDAFCTVLSEQMVIWQTKFPNVSGRSDRPVES
jgi:hypothetical protein